MPRLLPQNTPSLLSSIKTCPKLFFFPTSKMPCACFPSLKNIHQTTFFKKKQAFPFSTLSPAVVVIFTNTSSPGKSCDGVHSSIPDVLFFLCKPILGPAETDWVFSGFLLLLEVTNHFGHWNRLSFHTFFVACAVLVDFMVATFFWCSKQGGTTKWQRVRKFGDAIMQWLMVDNVLLSFVFLCRFFFVLNYHVHMTLNK